MDAYEKGLPEIPFIGTKVMTAFVGRSIPLGVAATLLIGVCAGALAQGYPLTEGGDRFENGHRLMEPVSVPITTLNRSPGRMNLTVPPIAFTNGDRPMQQVAQMPDDVPQEGAPIEAPEGAVPTEEEEAADAIEIALRGDTGGVLTRQGQFVIQQSVEYTRSSTERLVFRGVEIVPALLVGVIDASNVKQDAIVYTTGLRYGVTDTFELNVSVPYIYRNETSTLLVVRQGETEITRTLEGHGLGDIQFGARYQFPRPSNDWPFLIANLTAKSNTGRGPYDVSRDADGVAREPSLGSGFWGIRAGLSAIMPVQPAVLFANISYMHNIARNIDKTFGDIRIGRVDPGDTLSFGVGMGFSVTPDFSYSLGYSHDYIFPTTSELNGSKQRSSDAHVGAFQFGLSYAFTENIRTDLNFEFGVTEEASDVRVMLSVPIRF